MNDSFNVDVSNVKYWRSGIKIVAFLVYLAGALFATITFSQHVSGQFPELPVLRFMAFAGAWANFFSLAIMPLAKEYWINGRTMTIAAWLFWVLEFVMVVFNTLSAYASDWASWWTPLAPASPVMVIGIWGILWYLNPEAKLHQEQVDFYVKTQRDFIGKLQASMSNEDVQKIMDAGALQAARNFAEESLHVTIQNSRTRRTNKQAEPPNLTTPPMLAFNQEAQDALTSQANGGNTSRAAEASITDDGKTANPTRPRKAG